MVFCTRLPTNMMLTWRLAGAATFHTCHWEDTMTLQTPPQRHVFPVPQPRSRKDAVESRSPGSQFKLKMKALGSENMTCQPVAQSRTSVETRRTAPLAARATTGDGKFSSARNGQVAAAPKQTRFMEQSMQGSDCGSFCRSACHRARH